MRWVAGTTVAIWLVTAVVGCGLNPRAGAPARTAYSYLQTEIAGLDPAQAQEATTSVCVLQIYDALYEYEYLKRPYELKPCLAAALPEVSADGLTHTVRLQEGVLFHDDPCFPDGKGREMTADDVVFSLLRLMDARTASPGTWILEGYLRGVDAFRASSAGQAKHRTAYEPVEGIQAVDRYTVAFHLTRPYPQLHWVLAMPYCSVLPPEAVARYGDELLNHPVGTGPFVVDFFRRTQRLVLRRNPTYREDHYPTEGTSEDERQGRLEDAGKLLPLANRLVLTVYKESQPQWLDFLTGYLDRTSIPKDQFDNAIDPATRRLRADLVARDVVLEKAPQVEIIYDAFNMFDPVLGTANGDRGRAIRRAMSLAFNEAWARKKLYNDRLDSVQGLLVPEFPEFDPTFENPWKQRPDETREQALDRARAILAEAGYPNGEGIPPLTMEVNDSQTDQQFYEAFRRDMKEIGLEIRANRVTWSQMIARLDKGDAQLWGLAWTADYPDAQNFFQLFYGPNKAPGPNASNYLNPEFDRLYERTLALPPGPERTELYRKMQRMIVDDCVWIFKYRRVQYDLWQPWLHNYKRSAIQDKYGKFLRPDDALRNAGIEVLNPPNLVPVWIFLVGTGLIVGATLLAARRRVRAW